MESEAEPGRDRQARRSERRRWHRPIDRAPQQFGRRVEQDTHDPSRIDGCIGRRVGAVRDVDPVGFGQQSDLRRPRLPRLDRVSVVPSDDLDIVEYRFGHETTEDALQCPAESRDMVEVTAVRRHWSDHIRARLHVHEPSVGHRSGWDVGQALQRPRDRNVVDHSPVEQPDLRLHPRQRQRLHCPRKLEASTQRVDAELHWFERRRKRRCRPRCCRQVVDRCRQLQFTDGFVVTEVAEPEQGA